MRTLYQFPLSHFCEKARWLLDHKELDYVAQNLIPGVHRAFTQLKTGQNKLPVLKDVEQWIAGSTQIALYLDEHYPEHRFLSRDINLRAQALEIDTQANEMGHHVRRWVLAHALQGSDESVDILIGEKGYLRQFDKYTKPLLKKMVFKGYQLQSDKVAESKAELDQMIPMFNEILIANHGRYLLGSRLGLADIAVCSMLAPILALPGTPWETEHPDAFSTEFLQYREYLSELPLGQYVARIYANERRARVDWRGV
ncbi:glutathione S-transferase [Acinetobacter sp. B51(2017)]|uniref:glutathione S-transferase family protein n=1 Tax=Acinetobacter sp. B51(2017) TaxID=2060938 RepID=UPI000F097355|nr:glutathione S-transferase [Acinetobacter sp. B51(2017)]